MTGPEGSTAPPHRSRRAWIAAKVLVILPSALSIPVSGAAAQPSLSPGPTVAVDTATLAPEPPILMETVLEKTIFKVDVLTLRLRFGEPATTRLRMLAVGGVGEGTADSVAAAALAATDVWARIRFERDVSLSRFLDGVMENLERAHEAGIVTRAEVERLADGLPRWFGFLQARRILDGDELWYRIRGDTLRTLYVGVDREVLLDQTDVGAGPRRAVLGGYFAPGSDLRSGLIESLFAVESDSSR